MKVEYKRFFRRAMFQIWCKETFKGFDTYGRNLWCFTKDGEAYKAASVFGFAKNINEAYGETLLAKNCKSVGGRTTICLILEDDEVEAPVELISKEVVEESTEVEESASEELVLDLEKVESFEDSREGKLELEAYGKLFGIDLKRNQKIARMKAALIAHVNG